MHKYWLTTVDPSVSSWLESGRLHTSYLKPLEVENCSEGAQKMNGLVNTNLTSFSEDTVPWQFTGLFMGRVLSKVGGVGWGAVDACFLTQVSINAIISNFHLD